MREVSPTAFDRRSLELGRLILRDSKRLERELKMLADLESGLIRIGIGPLAAEMLLGRTWDGWQRIPLPPHCTNTGEMGTHAS